MYIYKINKKIFIEFNKGIYLNSFFVCILICKYLYSV